MSMLSWIADRFTKGGKAMSLYKRGMAKAKNHDHDGAIEDYTAAMGVSDASSEIKAMTLYNRALAYTAAGQNPKAADDLNKVLNAPESLINIKTMARQKLARMETKTRMGSK